MANRNKGFTLIEVIAYTAIVSIFIAAAFLISFRMIDLRSEVEQERELLENRRFLLQKIQWALNSADVINAPAIGVLGDTLSVNRLNYADNPVVIELSGGGAVISFAASGTIPLINSFARVISLTFEHQNFSGQSAIKVNAELENDFASTSIDTTIIIK